MEGSLCRKFSISWKGAGSRDRAQGSIWWGPGVPIYQGSGDLSPAWRMGEIIPGYISPTLIGPKNQKAIIEAVFLALGQGSFRGTTSMEVFEH
ncbi:hypothetical protein YC2023_107916 [Brassica napus]